MQLPDLPTTSMGSRARYGGPKTRRTTCINQHLVYRHRHRPCPYTYSRYKFPTNTLDWDLDLGVNAPGRWNIRHPTLRRQCLLDNPKMSINDTSILS